MTLQTQTTNGISGLPLLTTKGKVVGSRMTFAGEATASGIKAALKTANPKMKGAKLTKEVNKVLTGAKDIAWAKHDAAVSVLRSNGYVPDYVDARQKGATARYVRPTEAKSETTGEITREAALKALGLTEDQFKVLV
jgi:hypothetical protein